MHTHYNFNHVKRIGVLSRLPGMDIPPERCWKGWVVWACTGGDQPEARAAVPFPQRAASISKSPGSELWVQFVAPCAAQETSPQLPPDAQAAC